MFSHTTEIYCISPVTKEMCVHTLSGSTHWSSGCFLLPGMSLGVFYVSIEVVMKDASQQGFPWMLKGVTSRQTILWWCFHQLAWGHSIANNVEVGNQALKIDRCIHSISENCLPTRPHQACVWSLVNSQKDGSSVCIAIDNILSSVVAQNKHMFFERILLHIIR